ncbi:MAG: dihydrodipicolinate synthase family protein [bacterium]
MSKPFPSDSLLKTLRRGVVIPAHPLALNAERKFDEKRQRVLTRYYCAAGVGGIAIGVHTTQFDIRNPKIGLYEPVLSLTAETMSDFEATTGKELVRVAGIVGRTEQAVHEAALAAERGFHFGLVSLGALKDAPNSQLLQHLDAISEIIPIFGFYLQPATQGRVLDYAFWRRAVEIENMLAIKMAPFNRYRTLDVVRAVAESGRGNEIALYTGNDDNIVFDLLSEFTFGDDNTPPLRIVGGLLGHWAVWTKRAVELLEEIHEIKASHKAATNRLFVLAQQITDADSAIFDACNEYTGCIPGIHEILQRQGLLEGRWTLNPNADLSPGQLAEIERVCAAYPHLQDDEFVRDGLDEWMS